MARTTQRTGSGLGPSANVVGTAFTLQYYRILHESPDLVYRFYHGNSRVVRPSASGRVTDCVTTLKAIKKKIKAMGKVVRVQVDAVESKESETHGGGIAVVARGSVTLLGGEPRAFSQSFLLAPQDIAPKSGAGYFVLEDTFSYDEDDDGAAPADVGAGNDAEPAAGQGPGHCGGEQEAAGCGIQGDDVLDEIIVYQGRAPWNGKSLPPHRS